MPHVDLALSTEQLMLDSSLGLITPPSQVAIFNANSEVRS